MWMNRALQEANVVQYVHMKPTLAILIALMLAFPAAGVHAATESQLRAQLTELQHQLITLLQQLLGNTGTLPAPQNLSIDQSDEDETVLTWDDVPGATSYSIYRKTPRTTGYVLLENDITDTTYTDTEVPRGGNYYYYVTAHTNTATSLPSNERVAWIVIGAGSGGGNATILEVPVNTSIPVIGYADGSEFSGFISEDDELGVDEGVWSGTTPLTYTYQWLFGGDPIEGATESTFIATADYVSACVGVSVTVTATNAAGSASATSEEVNSGGDCR